MYHNVRIILSCLHIYIFISNTSSAVALATYNYNYNNMHVYIYLELNLAIQEYYMPCLPCSANVQIYSAHM